jgi:LmbE family N-acetylglucosaminyl deacetylase
MKNILAIGAHPDDLEFGCFGTLKKFKDQGKNITLVVMTASDVTHSQTGKSTRTKEQSIKEAFTAAEVIGANLLLLPYQDGEVPFSKKTVHDLEKIISEYSIDTIFTHWGGDTHQDHINTLDATLAASRMVNNVFCYEQVPLPRVCTTYPVANFYVDITDTIDYKIEASKKHNSQIQKYLDQDIDLIDNLKTLARFRGIQIGVKYAEAFNVLKYHYK